MARLHRPHAEEFPFAMRRVRYSVACSLDGCIAGPNGESDWIAMDPEIDFPALMASFDTIGLAFRRTFPASSYPRAGKMPAVPVAPPGIK
jgi:hypothetical protein